MAIIILQRYSRALCILLKVVEGQDLEKQSEYSTTLLAKFTGWNMQNTCQLLTSEVCLCDRCLVLFSVHLCETQVSAFQLYIIHIFLFIMLFL
jgi:hypothetical protein